MITAKQAYENLVSFQVMKPLTSIASIYNIIAGASLSGRTEVEFFVLEEHENKIKSKLRKLGFLIDVTRIASLPGEVQLTVNWVRSEFIGETEKELKGE